VKKKKSQKKEKDVRIGVRDRVTDWESDRNISEDPSLSISSIDLLFFPLERNKKSMCKKRRKYR